MRFTRRDGDTAEACLSTFVQHSGFTGPHKEVDIILLKWRGDKRKRNMGQNGKFLSQKRLTCDWSIQMETRLDMKPQQPGEGGEKRIPECPVQMKSFQKATGHDWAWPLQGNTESHVGCCVRRKSSKIIVILSVEDYVLMAEVEYKIEKTLLSVFTLTTFITPLTPVLARSTAGLATFHPRPATRCLSQTAESQHFKSRWEAGA